MPATRSFVKLVGLYPISKILLDRAKAFVIKNFPRDFILKGFIKSYILKQKI